MKKTLKAESARRGGQRREFLKLPLAAGALASFASPAAARQVIDEHDRSNIKLCRRLRSDISDDDLLFLKQIGLRWARVNFQGDADLDSLAQTQKRYESHGIKIFSGVHYAYRELDVQLGKPGRDKHIETYQRFLRNLGKLGIPVSCYDFHPANTYTTDVIETPRGYRAREFSVEDFRNKVEKQKFDLEYSAEEIFRRRDKSLAKASSFSGSAPSGSRMARRPLGPRSTPRAWVVRRAISPASRWTWCCGRTEIIGKPWSVKGTVFRRSSSFRRSPSRLKEPVRTRLAPIRLAAASSPPIRDSFQTSSASATLSTA